MSKSHRNVPAHSPQSSFLAPTCLPSLGAGMMSREVWSVTWVSPWQILGAPWTFFTGFASRNVAGAQALRHRSQRVPFGSPSGQQSWPPPKNTLWTFPSHCVGAAAVGTGGWEKPHKLSHLVTFHLDCKNLLVQHQLSPASADALDHRTLLIAQL